MRLNRGFSGRVVRRLSGRLGGSVLLGSFGVEGVALGILQLEQFLIGRKIEIPAASFVLGTFLRLQEEEGNVSQAGGAAGRDTVGGEGGEEIAENVVDVDLGDEIAGGAGELGGEIVVARRWLEGSGAGMGKAKAVVLGMGGQSAEASIGEFKLAKVEDIDWSRVRHGAIIDEYIP